MVVAENKNHEAARTLLRQAEDGKHDLFLAGISILNLDYHLRKSSSKELIRTIFKGITQIVRVCEVGPKEIQAALHSDWSNLEDAYQYACAMRAKADLILTYDKKFLELSSIRALTIQDYLNG